MIDSGVISESKDVKEGICSSCANAKTCVFIKEKHKTVWECELFVTESAKSEKRLSSKV